MRQLPLAGFFAICVLVAYGYGSFFLLPLFLQSLGGDEALVAQIVGAGTVGILLSVGFTGLLANVIGGMRVAALSAACLGLSTLGFALDYTIGPRLLLYGFGVGVGWGVFYTVCPMVVRLYATDRRLSLSYLVAFLALGMGVPPLAGKWLIDVLGSFGFLGLSALLCWVSVVGLFVARREHTRTPCRLAPGYWRAISTRTSLIAWWMTGINAVVFGTLMTYQTTYAQHLGLDYLWYYLAYTLTIIGARVWIAKWVVRLPLWPTVIVMEVVLLIGLAMLYSAPNHVMYALSAVVIAVGYSFIYPLMQAEALHFLPMQHHDQYLAMFCLVYFVGVFGGAAGAGVVIAMIGYEGMFGFLGLCVFGGLVAAIWK